MPPAEVQGATACVAPRVQRERGHREVFCGLTGRPWLYRKIQAIEVERR